MNGVNGHSESESESVDKNNSINHSEGSQKSKNILHKCSVLYDASSFAKFDPTQEPIFPPELKVRYQNFLRTQKI